MIDQFIFQPLPTSTLSVATTIHLAILLLLLHRGSDRAKTLSLLFPSVVFSSTPWMFPNGFGLAIGFALHTLWFVVCEKLIMEPVAVPTAMQQPVAPRPSIQPTRPTPSTPQAAGPVSVQVPVFAVFKETADITTFRMARPEGFDFEAGQFVTVTVKIDDRPVTRCYSISSGPEAKGYLEISVKKQGLMSGTLHATIRPGSLLTIRKPAGAFVFPKGDDRPVTLLAGGIGITPLMSMLRHGLNSAPNRPITLLYSVNWQRDVVFGEELRWIEKRHPQIKIVVATTHGPHSSDYQSGRIDRQMIIDNVPNPVDNVFLICGPPPMIAAMQSLLSELEIPESQIRFEKFEAAIAASQAPPPVVGVDPANVPTESQSQIPLATAFDVRLANSNQTIAANSGHSLLESCEEAGIEIPSICRAGVCGTCRTRVIDGKIRCDSDALNDSDKSQGYVLACVAWPESDCAIEA